MPTRWNSFHDSLTALLQFDSKLGEICKLVGVTEFKQTEIEFLKQYLSCVQPVAAALDRLQGESNSFYGELIPTLLQIEKQLVALSRAKPEHCEHLPELILESLRKRFKEYLGWFT